MFRSVGVGVAAALEERRTVTVVFVDMVGFTTRTANLDPEDIRDLQHEYFRVVSEILHRWNGVVEKYIGDAVMAVFGARTSTEHDAYRAVRAGLEVQQAFSTGTTGSGPLRWRPTSSGPVQVRVGIATGEAVVDLAAATDGGQTLVAGAVVSIAARVQSAAPIGGVVVTAATREATRSLVQYQEVPPVTITSAAGPCAVWRANATIRPNAEAAPGDNAPMVGRHGEFTAIADQLNLAFRRRTPTWISVVGHAGTGKSRMIRELISTFGAQAGNAVLWRVGHCSPWERSERLREPILLAEASLRPLVVVVEDIQWADPVTMRSVREVFCAAVDASLPLAVVVTHRPDTVELPQLPAHASSCTVTLRPLAAGPTGELLRCLLTQAGQSLNFVDTLRPLVAGIPLYAQEYVRMIAAGAPPVSGDRAPELPASAGPVPVPVPELPVPEPVRRIVSARLGRLPRADRTAVQVAAVLGDHIRADALASLLRTGVTQTHALLRRLETSAVLVERPERTPGDQPEYAFADPALRQVAHGQLPRAVRADHHRRAAVWLTRATVTPVERSEPVAKQVRREAAAFDVTHVITAPARTAPARKRHPMLASAGN